MLAWFRKRREAVQRASERAERLMRDHGAGPIAKRADASGSARDLETSGWRWTSLRARPDAEPTGILVALYHSRQIEISPK